MEKVVVPIDVMMDEVALLLDEGREVIFKPKGHSMLPFIREDVDSVKLRRQETLHIGDIVLVRINTRYVLHRIYAIEGKRLTLMGDGNLQGVELGTCDDVKGRVVEIISPKGKARKPTKGLLWRKLLPIRKYLLKIDRKLNKVFA